MDVQPSAPARNWSPGGSTISMTTTARSSEAFSEVSIEVSVVMPVYNAERYLDESLGSILGQEGVALALVVIDDASTDGSLAALDRAAARDPRVRVLRASHRGIVATLEDGIAAARAPIIARMDADDVAVPGRLAAQLDYLRAHPDCVAVGAATEMTDSRGLPQWIARPPVGHAEIDAEALGGNGMAMVHGAMMMRRQAVLDVGGYRPHFNLVEDLDLVLRLAEHGRLANLPDIYMRYRQHAGSTCALNTDAQTELKREAIREAYARRGRPLPPEPICSPERRLAPAPQALLWALVALRRGRLAIAASHGADAVRLLPRSPAEVIRTIRSVAYFLKRRLERM